MSKPTVTIYTDGSCDPNPGPGGWAAILSYDGYERILQGHSRKTTNNRMELRAAINALKRLKSPCSVTLYTDSKYLRDGADKWLDLWRSKGWRRADGKPLKNADLWEQIHQLAEYHTITWKWVSAHSDSYGNQRADTLATSARRNRINGQF